MALVKSDLHLVEAFFIVVLAFTYGDQGRWSVLLSLTFADWDKLFKRQHLVEELVLFLIVGQFQIEVDLLMSANEVDIKFLE